LGAIGGTPTVDELLGSLDEEDCTADENDRSTSFLDEQDCTAGVDRLSFNLFSGGGVCESI
jgi:hypothetical protein